MRQLLLPFYLLTIMTLSACSHTPVSTDFSNQYCDQYFIYEMCVRDISGNGEVDYMYFSDTMEIFMLGDNVDVNAQSDVVLHKCVQNMNTDMRTAGSRLLYINIDTPSLQKTRLKAQLMFVYTRYRDKVSQCHNTDIASPDLGSDFGDEEFEEL